MSTEEITKSFEGVDFPKLERSLRHPRTFLSAALSLFTALATIVACIPLFSLLLMLIVNGGRGLALSMFTDTPPVRDDVVGGFGNSLVGTLVMVGIASAVSIPLAILAAVFLAEFGPESRTAAIVRFCAKTLTGLPSIMAGILVVVLVSLFMQRYQSAPAGGLALGLLMFPTVLLIADEAMRMVPAKMKEAAVGMGATKTQVVWNIVLPTAMPGILTGVMLAIARAAGETAPVWLAASFSERWIWNSKHQIDLMQPTASLSVQIWQSLSSPWDNVKALGWSAALILVLLVLSANIAGQLLSSRAVKA